MGVGQMVLRLFGIQEYDGDLEHIQPNTWELFAKAKSSIKIVAGELTSDFYNHPGTLKALETVINRGVSVDIVTGPDIDKSSARALLESGARIHKLERRPRVHFSIIDNKHVKVEEPHAPSQRDRVYYIKQNTYSLARDLQVKFDKLLEEAEPLTPDQL